MEGTFQVQRGIKSTLLALAEQCIGGGCLKAAFIFIKRTGNWGPWPCLPFVISSCLPGCRGASGTTPRPVGGGNPK